MINIYTDGGCSGNPGPGGWGYVILVGDTEAGRGSGREKLTTNNKMELTAVIEALQTLKKMNYFENTGSEMETVIYTDSTYVKNGITEWIGKWIKNGWKTAARLEVKNRELWISLKELSDSINPQWKWVKGHAGNRWNEECDSLVRKEIDSIMK